MRAQVRRHTLEKWLGEPFFERTLVGALVRVAIKRAYILAEVIQAQEREPGTYRRAHPCAANAILYVWCIEGLGFRVQGFKTRNA